MDRLARQNSQWQQRVKRLLKDGWGVEDIAVKTGAGFEDVRREVEILRQSGELAKIYEKSRS